MFSEGELVRMQFTVHHFDMPKGKDILFSISISSFAFLFFWTFRKEMFQPQFAKRDSVISNLLETQVISNFFSLGPLHDHLRDLACGFRAQPCL